MIHIIEPVGCQPMNIEIFSDLICPWCFIGKRRLDLALNSSLGEGINLIWRAYQLYPGIPENGMSRGEFMRVRYGTSDQSAGRGQLESQASGVGIDMRFERIERMPNTFSGHRLLHRARVWGVQHELAETLFSAYFEEGKDLGDDEVLLEAAASHGMDRQEVEAFLEGDEGSDAVQAEIERASNIGVTGVPCFILAGAFALPGAQDPQVIGQFIERARTKLSEIA